MENNNDQKWKLADVLANFTKSQLQKQQEIAIREEMKQRMMDAQAQNLAQFVPGAQPAPQEQGFPQDFAMAKEGGIHIDPSKRGTFKAQATRMGMSVQEAARHILANKDKYSPKMVKKANFARNFAKAEGGEMLNMGLMGGDDDDRRWWQFWKKNKPMTFEDKMKQELGMLTKNLMEIEAAIVYYTQKGGVNQSSFDEGLNNYHNSYSNYIEQLKNTREKLLLEKGKIENALNNKTADDKRKEEEIAQMKYDEARIKADKEAAKRKAEEESYLKHRQELKDQANQKAYGGQMFKRADGSYSQRGLWDNIRANKGSGKAPTKEMLAQERKIKRKRYDDGGTLPSCEEGYYWNPDKQSCEPIANYSNLNEHQKFMISMANSPLFEERYNRMIGKKDLQIPMQQTEYGPEEMPAEQYRRNMINNIATLKYAEPGIGGFEDKHKDADAYYSGISNLDELKATYEKEQKRYDNSSKFYKMMPWNKFILKVLKRDYETAKEDDHTIYQRDVLETPYILTHETAHGGTRGLLNKKRYKMKFRNPYENEPGFEDHKKWFDMEINSPEIEKYYEGQKDYYEVDNEEANARKYATLKFMKDKGIMDPTKENFTEKHYYQLLDILFDDNSNALNQLKPLFVNFTKEQIMSMFNDLVQNKSDKTNDMAKRGGQLGRFLL